VAADPVEALVTGSISDEEASVGLPISGEATLSAPETPDPLPEKAAPSLSLEQAEGRLGPNVLAALEARFKGSLVSVRVPDERDLIF